MGFSINVSECCRAMKIKPARTLARNLGLELQITGQRGSQDDSLRGLRTLKDGHIFYQQRDRLWIVNPLTDWTDAEIQGYIKQHKLEEHPARTRGALTIGCVYCGGGSQYTNSGYRILRKTWPEAWRRLIVEWGVGFVILALKHKRPIYEIAGAVQELGGLQTLAKFQPWLFDFTRKTPQPGYQK
jgi:3'-phosphoadenosine 5'-phosphosulfate sulfotransferase (PAPS reductase)/FAD synthetase